MRDPEGGEGAGDGVNIFTFLSFFHLSMIGGRFQGNLNVLGSIKGHGLTRVPMIMCVTFFQVFGWSTQNRSGNTL